MEVGGLLSFSHRNCGGIFYDNVARRPDSYLLYVRRDGVKEGDGLLKTVVRFKLRAKLPPTLQAVGAGGDPGEERGGITSLISFTTCGSFLV